MRKPKILDCTFVRGNCINYIYATLEGAEMSVIGTAFSEGLSESDTDDFIGLTKPQAERLFARKRLAALS